MCSSDLPLNDKQRHYVETVHSSGTHLLRLINDILDLSKIEAGRLQLECIPFSLRTILAETAELYRAQAIQKGVALTWEVSDRVPETFQGDPYRVRQVLGNLISNAMKFTEKGSVRLTASLADDRNEAVRIAIADSGIGIPADKQETVFNA